MSSISKTRTKKSTKNDFIKHQLPELYLNLSVTKNYLNASESTRLIWMPLNLPSEILAIDFVLALGYLLTETTVSLGEKLCKFSPENKFLEKGVI